MTLVAAIALVGVWAGGLQAQPLPPTTSRFAPDPSDGRLDVWRDTRLEWTAVSIGQRYDVYFGAVFDDVNEASRSRPLGVLVRRNQQGVGFDPGRLEFGRTYYWRVDEVGGPPAYTISRGPVWSFTTERLAYRIEKVTAQASSAAPGSGPERTIDGSGLNDDDAHATAQAAMWLTSGGAATPAWLQYSFDQTYKLHEMWVWNGNGVFEATLGFGLKDVTIEYSSDGISWMRLGDFEFAQAPGRAGYTHNTTVNLGSVLARHVRITAHSNWGGASQSSLSEVRFFRIPMRAHHPEPALEAVGVGVDGVLRWQPGRQASWHELHISPDVDAVLAGTALVDVLVESRFPVASLDLAQTYYWRVDEVNHTESPGLWTGDLWHFTTQEYLAVDDFESYDNDKNRIYETWIDGYGTSENGSQVGHLDAPFAEQVIVHSGLQSMPLFYDNAGGAARSEAQVTWSAPQNWIAQAANTLVLHVRGEAGNDRVTLYLVVEDNAGRRVVLEHPDSNVVRSTAWQVWRIPFSHLGTVGMHMTSIARLTIGLGHPDYATPGGSGVIYVDDILIGRPLADQ
jgi:hypothetical protein